MPRLHLVTIGLLASVLVPHSASAAIGWARNLAEAQQIAQQEQRLVLLHFYADWCGPCRRLEREVFPRPDVVAAIHARYVPVKIDGDKHRDLARHYQVDRFPMDVICDPSGRPITRFVPTGAEHYIETLNQVATGPPAANPPIALASGQQSAQAASGPWSGQAPGSTEGSGDAAAWGRRYPDEDRWQPPAAAADNYAQPSSWAAAAPQPAAYGPLYADPYHAAPPAGGDTQQTAPQQPAPRDQYNPYATAPPSTVSTPSTPSTASTPSTPSTPADPAAPPALASRSPQWSGPPQPARDLPRQGSLPPAGDAGAAATAPLGLDGFCPVTLADFSPTTQPASEAWQPGDPRWGAVHRGRTYLFASEAHQQRFLADPDRYSPVLSGYDPTRFVDAGEAALGKRNHGMWFRGKMYLFSDEASLERFFKAPEYYAQKSHEAMMWGQRR